MMNVKTARKLYDTLEKLLGDNAAAVMTYELESQIAAAEVAQEEIDALTDEDRADCAENEEFECEADYREAMAEVETGFEEIIEQIDNLRDALNKADEAITEAFNEEADEEAVRQASNVVHID